MNTAIILVVYTYYSGGEFGLGPIMSTSFLLVAVMLTTSIMTIVIILLIRAKGRNQKILKQLAKAKASAIYDEIVDKSPPGSPQVGTETNVAYEQVAKVI